MFNQLASWLFSTSKTDTRARFHRVEKAAGPVPSCSFERSFGLYRRCCLPGGRFGRRGVRAARRLRDFTWCDEFVRFLRSLQNKKFLEFQFHARRKKALPLSEARAPFASTTARDPPKLANKKKKMSNDDRACASYFFVAVLFDSFATTIPLSRCVYRRPKDGGGVCVCVDIRKNISLCHSCLFLPTINRIIKGRLLKKNSWLSRVFRSKKSTHFDMENGRGLFHHQPTKKKARASCADFSFFTTESKNPKTKRHFFLDDGIFTSRHKKDKNPVVVPARS